MNAKIACKAWAYATCILVFASLAPNRAKAQFYYHNNYRSDHQWETDINVGLSNFLGDVGGNKGAGTLFLKDINTKATTLFYGANITYYPNQWLGIRASFNIGSLTGADSLIKSGSSVEQDRKKRNLSFKSPIKEGLLNFEIYPLAFLVRKESFFNANFRPYIFAGIGGFYYNPQAQYTDGNGRKTWVDLKDLHLEGQGFAEYPDRKQYSNYAVCIPFGFGAKYFLNDNVYVGIEAMQRYTFTDYIDNVSTTYINPNLFDKYLPKGQAAIAKQLMYKRGEIVNRPVTDFIDRQRGDASNKDYYLSVFFKLGIRFGGRDSDMSCPRARF
jgi:hypothetical protein